MLPYHMYSLHLFSFSYLAAGYVTMNCGSTGITGYVSVCLKLYCVVKAKILDYIHRSNFV
jgi:hypothetical protein